MWVRSLGREDPLQKEMATHSSILACKIPWAEEPGGLQSMGLQRVGLNLAIKQQQMCFTLGWVWKPRIPFKKKKKRKTLDFSQLLGGAVYTQ